MFCMPRAHDSGRIKRHFRRLVPTQNTETLKTRSSLGCNARLTSPSGTVPGRRKMNREPAPYASLDATHIMTHNTQHRFYLLPQHCDEIIELMPSIDSEMAAEDPRPCGLCEASLLPVLTWIQTCTTSRKTTSAPCAFSRGILRQCSGTKAVRSTNSLPERLPRR